MTDKIIEIINRNVDAELIYIFGSYGTERYTADSDIDIAFSSKNVVSKDIMRKIWFELVEDLLKEVDLIDINSCGLPIKKEIISKGQVIYEKEKGTNDRLKFKIYALYGQYLEDVSIVKKRIKERGRVLCKK